MTEVVKAPTLILPDLSGLTLDELGERVRCEFALSETAIDVATAHLSEAIVHAIKCGAALVEAQGRIEESGWLRWLETTGLKPPQVSKCVRLFVHRDHLPLGQRVTTKNALAYLRGLPRTGRPGGPPRSVMTDEVITEAKRLRSSGLSVEATAEALDIGRHAVRYWTEPNMRKNALSAAKRRRKEERAALVKQRRSESFAKAGGSIKKAYDLVRSLSRELDAALGNATDTDMRNALRAAYSAATRSEGELLRALRLGDTGDNT